MNDAHAASVAMVAAHTMSEQMSEKYKLGEPELIYGVTLHRVIALRDFGDIKKGDVGGYVESERNLSQFGNAWVSGDAWVTGDAIVSGDAVVTGYARVRGDAIVSGDARVKGDNLITISHIGSRNDTLTASTNEAEVIIIIAGCFVGTLDEFVAAVEKKHAGNRHYRDYMAAVELIKSRLG